MNNITEKLNEHFYPEKSLIIYRSNAMQNNHYVESYDFDQNCKMINAHPLTENEMADLGKLLMTKHNKEDSCFVPKGLLDNRILYLKHGEDGFVIWQSCSSKQNIEFTDDLGLPSGIYPTPSLLWKAGVRSLEIYALKTITRATLKTKLFHAPYFNIYENGNVCMGTVDIYHNPYDGLEGLINKWEQYFFNSRFSHLLSDRSPVKSNIIQLYKALYQSTKTFPLSELIPLNKTINNLIHEYSN